MMGRLVSAFLRRSLSQGKNSAMPSPAHAVEYRRYQALGHGFGLGTGTSAEGRAEEAVRFWSEVKQLVR